jgi:hypothetical protein
MTDQADRNRARRDAEMAAELAADERRAREHFARSGRGRLTPRQARFVEAYIVGDGGRGMNATRAAEAAGYRWPSKQGPRLMTFPAVAEAIRAAMRAVMPEFADLM